MAVCMRGLRLLDLAIGVLTEAWLLFVYMLQRTTVGYDSKLATAAYAPAQLFVCVGLHLIGCYVCVCVCARVGLCVVFASASRLCVCVRPCM